MKIDKLHPKEDTPELFMNERIIYLQPTVRLKNNFYDGTKNEEKKYHGTRTLLCYHCRCVIKTHRRFQFFFFFSDLH